MAERIAYLEAVVGADITQFRKSMRDIRTETNILSDVIGGISGAARTMTYAFTAPMVALGTYAVQAASTFDAQMRNINSIAQMPEAALVQLSQRVLEFGKYTRGGAESAAAALYEVYSAGLMGEDAFTTMSIASKTAEAGLADLTGTVKGLTAAGLTFGDTSAAAMQRYSDATTLAVQLGVGSMDVFNTGISNVIGTGSLLGATFEDLSASIAFLSQRGVSFASAGTYLNNTLSKLIKPTEDMDAMFKTLHVKSGKDLIETFGGIEGALRAIYGQIGSDETKWSKLFPDVRGFKAVAPFIKAFKEDGNDAVNEFFTNFNDKMKAGNVTADAWEQQMKSFAAVVDHFKSALQGVAIVIGQAIMPILSPIIDRFTDFLNAVSSTNPEVIKLAVVFTAVVAAAAPVVWLLTSMISPIGVLVGAIAALSVAFATNFGGIQTTVTNAVKSILGDITPLTNAFQDFWKDVFPAMPTTQDITGGQTLKIQSDDIITVEKPMSLWELYTSKGYDKYFSWTEFMKKAREGGWDGKGLDVGDKIKLPNPDAMNGAKNSLDKVALGVAGVGIALDKFYQTPPVSTPPKLGFLERLQSAAETAWPKISEALGKIWDNIKNWVETTGIPALDGFGGNILATITGWFNPTKRQGKTEAYNTFRDVFGGGAANGVNAGIAKLQETFPEITAGLKAMVDSIGAWLSTEGIPTVSRSIGYFVGKIGATFGELLGQIGSALTGADGGKAADGIKNSVVSPAMLGFQDAMKDAGVKGGIDQLFSGLAGMLVTAAGVSVFGQLLIGKGFLSAIWSTLGTVLSGGGAIVGGIGGVGGKLVNGLLNTSAGAEVANKVNNFAGSILSTISDGISIAAGKASSLFSKVASPILSSISDALETKALQSMMLWDKVTAAVGSGIAKATGTISAVTGWVVKAAGAVVTPIAGAITSLFAAMPLLPVVLAGITIVGIMAIILPDEEKKKIADMFAGWFNPASMQTKLEPTVDFKAKVGDLQLDFDSNSTKLTPNTVDSLNYFLMNSQMGMSNDQAATYSAAIDKVILDVSQGKISKEDAEPQLQKLVADAFNGVPLTVKNPEIKMDFSADKAQYEPAAAIMKPPDDAKAKKLADDMLNPVWTQVATNIATNAAVGGTTDTTVMAQSMTKPFVTEFTTAFGTTGSVTTKWQEFVVSVNKGLDENMKKMGDTTIKTGLMSAGMIIANALAIASFDGYNKVRDTLQALQSDADKLAGSLQALVNGSPYKVEVQMTTTGSVPTTPSGAKGSDDGSHATGLWEVPYDNYRARLHQGETVLDKQDASIWRNLPQMMANMKPPKAEQQPMQNNTIVLNGIQDVDTVLRELERRGIRVVSTR